MLQNVCEYVHNYFIKTVQRGSYEIADDVISLSDVLEGQRILIKGSCLNDGLYTYHETGLTNDDDTEAAGLADESFTGAIYALAVPPAVIALSGEIKDWVAKFGDVVNSPYQSESFGGYSYTRASGSGNASESGKPGGSWEQIYASRLNRWRRISDEPFDTIV